MQHRLLFQFFIQTACDFSNYVKVGIIFCFYFCASLNYQVRDKEPRFLTEKYSSIFVKTVFDSRVVHAGRVKITNRTLISLSLQDLFSILVFSLGVGCSRLIKYLTNSLCTYDEFDSSSTFEQGRQYIYRIGKIHCEVEPVKVATLIYSRSKLQ